MQSGLLKVENMPSSTSVKMSKRESQEDSSGESPLGPTMVRLSVHDVPETYMQLQDKSEIWEHQMKDLYVNASEKE